MCISDAPAGCVVISSGEALMRQNRTWRAMTTRAAALSLTAVACGIGAWTTVGSREHTAFIAEDLTRLAPFDIIVGGDLDPGERLIAELNCVACHAVEPEVANRLDSKEAPILGQVGRRLSPEHLAAWLADPQKVKPGTMMPQIFTGLDPAIAERVIDPLVHFLVSLGGVAPLTETEFDESDVKLGRVLYHQVGCVACHAPREAPSVLQPILKPETDNPYGGEDVLATEIPVGAKEGVAPLGSFTGSNIKALAAFLQDPVSVRPSGRMPAMDLTEDEARAIATYLIATDVQAHPEQVTMPAARGFGLDPEKRDKGMRIFAAMGCADCHEMGPNRTAVEPQRPVPYPGLFELKKLDQGCLAPVPPAMAANYSLTDAQRQAIRKTLQNRNQLKEPLSPADSIDRTLSAMNCYACHARDGQGSVDPARRDYFITLGEAELGDEGRIPPPLTGVGSKLLTGWMSRVISEGLKVRPYMATRMPAWTTVNAPRLAGAFEAVDAPCPIEELPPAPFSASLAADGLRLVGTGRGMACINCHSIKGSDPIGEPAMDLVTTHERLRSDWFHTYMRDPDKLRPGTRMPNHWPADQPNPFPEIQGGDPEAQINAIWAYLSQGEFLAMPEGVAEEGGYEIVVRDEPVVFRTFIKGAGARAIAIGFKEQVHLAFNAEECRVTEIWRGAFLNASGAWAGRGGNSTDPLGSDVLACGTALPFQALESNGEIMSNQPEPKFRGYRFDDRRQPILQYEFADWVIDEQPLPVLRPTAPGLRRVFEVSLAPGRASAGGLAFVVASGSNVSETGRDQFNVDGRVVYDLRYAENVTAKVHHFGGQDHLVLMLGNTNVRQARFEVGITW